MAGGEQAHKPVLIDEVMDCLQPQGAGVYVDCTFGRGGYSGKILNRLSSHGKVLALDTDPDAITYGKDFYKDDERLLLQQSNYEDIRGVAREHGLIDDICGIVFDLGVSSPQLDDASRGFSFRKDGPLDMRMNPQQGISAQEWLNAADESEIKKIIWRYGEERFSPRIAKRIVEERNKTKFETTRQLAEVVYQAIPERERVKRRTHPATKVFQAIRMHVNDELGHLERGLRSAIDLVSAGAIIVVVSFHSLEDRLVKRAFRRCVEGEPVPDKLPLTAGQVKGDFEYVSRLTMPSAEEVGINARARSARLRAIRKLQRRWSC